MKHKLSITKEQIATILFGLVLQVYLLYPWIRTEIGNYNVCTFLWGAFREGSFTDFVCRCFPKGIEHLTEAELSVMIIFCGILFGCMLIEQILILSSVICSFFQMAPRILSTISSILTVVMCMPWAEVGFVGVRPDGVTTGDGINTAGAISKAMFVYPFFMILITGVWFISIRIMGVWDEASKKAHEERMAKKAYRKERKRRLKFPGRYCRLHYRVLWKNLWHNQKDYFFLLLAGIVSVLFIFLGAGLWNMLRNSAGSQNNDYIMLSLSAIMMEFIVISIIITFLLLMLVLAFYRKKRMAGNGLFETLGVRSNVMFAAWMVEMTAAFIISVAAGLLLGNVLLRLIRTGIEKIFPELGSLPMPESMMYMMTVFIMFLVSLLAYGFAHDIDTGQKSADGRAAAVRQEPMPGKYRMVLLALGVFLIGVSLSLFGQRRMSENIYLLCLFFAGMYLAFRNGLGMYLERKRKNMGKYLRDLPKEQMVYYRFQTTVKYMMLFLVLDVCVLFFFSMRVSSNQAAQKAENIYPYDYVCMANDGDEKDRELFDKLKEECKAKITTLPMMRVTTLDATSEPNKFLEVVPFQGQNIGVSESTYRELMKLAGEEPKEDLGLSDNGKNIHIVYQQDEGTDAKPLDWYMGVKEPFVHIGQPLLNHSPYTRRETYPIREIAGEERVILTGGFRKGIYENIVVFSDAYFEKMKDDWKSTDIWTGEPVEPEEAKLEVNIHEWPDQLQLVHVPEAYLNQADEIIQMFRENHAYDEFFDSQVQSAYSKREEIQQRNIERLLESGVNGLVILLLLAEGVFLLYMKAKMDLPEMKVRYQFMENFGMREKERFACAKREVSRFVWVPLLLSVPFVLVFTVETFWMRMPTKDMLLRYAGYEAVIWFVYVAVKILVLKFLEREIKKTLAEKL